MKIMLPLFFFISLLTKAQQTQEFSIDLNSKCWLKKHAYSSKISLDNNLEYSFAGISAYTLDTANNIHLEYRIKTETWQDWTSMKPPHSSESTKRQSFVAEPVYENIRAIQIRANDSLEEALVLRIYFASAEKKSPKQNLNPSNYSSCNCQAPPICDRNCWCPNGQCPPPSTYTSTTPTHIIVHHSAGFNTSSDFASVVAYYWDLHVNTNGWDDIGYNYLIDPNGVVYEGRGTGNQGAHFSCMNGNTTGICIIGDYTNTQVSNAALHSLIELMAWESCNHNIAPSDSSFHNSSQLLLHHISGHRDGNNASVGCPSGTACPGDMLYAQLDSLAHSTSAEPCLVSTHDFANQGFNLYPNPSTGILNLSFPHASTREMTLLDASGKVLQHWERKESDLQLDISQFKSGNYILQIRANNKSSGIKIYLITK